MCPVMRMAERLLQWRAMLLRSVVLLLALGSSFPSAVVAATVPAGFSETTLASGLSGPTAMALAPDGRVFVCEQGGAVRVIKDGALLAAPFVTLTVNSSGERGLLGIAFDPDFLVNHYVYLYYTATAPLVHNRISRLTAAGDVAAAGSETTLLDLNNLNATNHNGGALHFGGDGKLYAGVGENAVSSNSQTLANMLGKMLRLNSDGTIPTDNPFYGTASGSNRSIWALGLRNPFTFAIHPVSGRIFINDVGQAQWEEIDDGVAGGNYGWPVTEGPASDPRFISPTYAYANFNATECAIAGGAFYAPAVRQFPGYAESYFFSDLCGGWIRSLDQSAQPHDFASGISNPVDLVVGHDGSLLYLSRAGTVVRISRDARLEGDVDGDGETTEADVFYLANYLHAGGPAPVQGGDVDGNGVLNTADLSYLISYLLGGGPSPV
jgi:glucose/arabinose dehydrogenase